MGHRLSEWTGHGPMLEQDIAISNMALDLIGQARNFYQYAAQLIGNTTEDNLAFLRNGREYKNLLITELPNGDWAMTIGKLFFFSAYKYCLFEQLSSCSNAQLAAIAEKSLKEVTYHRRWSSEWVIRLGDGTEESKSRMQSAITELWPFTGEMFRLSEYEADVYKHIASLNVRKLKDSWSSFTGSVLAEALITVDKAAWMQEGGKRGIHTEHLGLLLAEMQYMQRTYPGCEW